jgi:hypothetical protein
MAKSMFATDEPLIRPVNWKTRRPQVRKGKTQVHDVPPRERPNRLGFPRRSRFSMRRGRSESETTLQATTS